MMLLELRYRILGCMVGVFTTTAYADCDVLSVTCIQKHVACLTTTPYTLSTITFADVQFDDEIVQQCARDIEQTKSFKPLLKTWDFLKENNADEVVLGKFSLLLLLSYHTIFYAVAHKNRISFFSIIPLYYQLSKIPLTKLFDSLEECWNQYQAIIANYKPDEEESFISWVQNYWWVSATMVVFTVMSFIQWYRSHSKLPKRIY